MHFNIYIDFLLTNDVMMGKTQRRTYGKGFGGGVGGRGGGGGGTLLALFPKNSVAVNSCSSTLSAFATTSFPELSYEDEARHEKALVWAGHVTTQNLAVFDSYSSRSGEIFFNEIYKSSKQINSQKTSQSILFMCRAKFGTNQLKSLKSLFSKIYRYIWRFSTTGKAASKLHLGVSMQVVIHTKFAFSRLEQYGYCY